MIEKWHNLIKSGDVNQLEELLADEIVFFSPVVYTPQRGKKLATMYLTGAFYVLLSENFKYTKEVINDNVAVLEFETELDGIKVNGVDIISWNEEEKITEFKVMVRPQKGMEKLQEEMWKLLQKMK